MLGGISLLLMQRLPQDLVTQTFFGTAFGLAQVQLVWLLLALDVATTLGIVVRSDSLAAPLQVHVGGGRRRAAAADVRLRHARSTASA